MLKSAHTPTSSEGSGEGTKRSLPEPVLGGDDTLPVLASSDGKEELAGAWPVELDIAGATDLGLVRQRNEDHYLVADLERQLILCDTSVAGADPGKLRVQREAVLLAVADGMGGHAGGAMASQVVLDALAGYLIEHSPWSGKAGGPEDEGAVRELRRALAFCQRRLDRVAGRKGMLEGHPGTTLTAAFVSWPGLLILHVGDSRMYLRRQGALSQLTTDHTLLADDAGRKVARGEPMRHVLLNAIVSGSRKAVGEIRWVQLEPNDALLLCTDGLSEHVTDEVLTEVIGRAGTASDACAQLIELARDAGGSDNITAVIARFTPAGTGPL